MSSKSIVAVQFKDKKDPTQFGKREYTYYSAVKLQVGDIVTVPTAYGSSEARVSKINMKPSEIDVRFEDRVKTITCKPEPLPAHNGNAMPVQKCRVCGCTDFNACPGGCWWVEADLCSACADTV